MLADGTGILKRATPEEIVAFVRRRRFPLADEKVLQSKVAECLTEAGYAFLREHRLSDRDIPDFMFPDDAGGGFVLELKIKGSKRSIYDQCARYCGFTEVTGLVLGTNVPTGFPQEIAGKPCWVASLGMGWL